MSMSIYEYWLGMKLKKIVNLGFTRVTVTFDGTTWEIAAMTRGQVYGLGVDTRLRKLLREATEAAERIAAQA